MRAKLTKEEMMERIKFYEENGEAAFITKYNRYRGVIYVYRKKLGLSQSRKPNRKYELPKIYSRSKFVNFTKEDKIKFIEYYKIHTAKDAGKHYGISPNNIYSITRSFSLEVYSKPFFKNKYKRKVGAVTKEEKLDRIKFYKENGEDALKKKYKITASAITRYRYDLNLDGSFKYRSANNKREMIEYYKMHSAKETAIKYGYSSGGSAASAINYYADELGYPKPLKRSVCKRIATKAEMLDRIKFYEENGIEKYADKYDYCNKSTAHGSIVKYCKYLKRM